MVTPNTPSQGKQCYDWNAIHQKLKALGITDPTYAIRHLKVHESANVAFAQIPDGLIKALANPPRPKKPLRDYLNEVPYRLSDELAAQWLQAVKNDEAEQAKLGSNWKAILSTVIAVALIAMGMINKSPIRSKL